MSDNIANKRIARNSIYMSIRMVIVLLIGLYTTRAVLSLLGVEDYGVYNVVCGFVSMFAFLNTSMSNGIQRFFNFEYGKNGIEGAKNVFCTSVVIQAFLAIFVIVLCESLGSWYLHNKMVIPEERMLAADFIFQFSMLSFIFVIFQAPYTAAVMAHEKMDFFAITAILTTLSKLIIVLLIPYLTGDYLILYGLLLSFISFLELLIYYIYCRCNFCETSFTWCFQKETFKSMLGFSGWNLFGSFSGTIREQGINLIINMFFGPIVNAARGVAMQINGGFQSFVSNLTIPVRPQVIQSFAIGNTARTMNLTYSISKLSCYFLTMMAIPVCLEIDTVLELWLGDNVPAHSATFAIIVILCSYQGNLNSAISGVVHATGKMKNYQLCCSLVKMMSIPFAYLFLKYGSEAEIALILVFIFDILGHIVGLFILKGLINISLREYLTEVMLPILKVLGVVIIICYPIHIVIDNPYLRILIISVIAVILVFLSVYLIGLNPGEKILVKNMIQKIKTKLNRYDKKNNKHVP